MWETGAGARAALFATALDRAAGAAGLLDRHVAEVAVGPHSPCADEVGDLHDLAAKAHEEDAAEVRVARIARERAEERVVALVRPRHAAPGTVDDGDDAVDVGVVGEPRGLLGGFGDEARDGAGAVHRGEDAEVVARAHLSVGAVVAHEGPFLGRRGEGAAVLAEGVVLLVFAHAEVVGVDVVACGDVLGRRADDLAVAVDRGAFRNVRQGDLVAALHLGPGDDPELGEGAAGGHVLERDGHVVGGMQADHAGRQFGH
jgi:hypothetical protein